MVCDKCEKKLSKHPCQDTWKSGSRNTIESGGRKLNENKVLSTSKRWKPYGAACKLCKSSVQDGSYKYCQKCAYAKALCAMCGKQMIDTKELKRYKQSTA